MKQELKTQNKEDRIQAIAQTTTKKNDKRPLTQKQGYSRLIFHFNWGHLYVVAGSDIEQQVEIPLSILLQ